MYHVGISFKGMGSLDTYGMSLGGGSSLLLKTIYQAKVWWLETWRQLPRL